MEEKVFTVYKTTNKVNGKYYIGVHKTSNPFDDYIGSGKYLKRAVEKYGIENFEKEILAIFDNAEEAFELEAELVTFDLIESKESYNLKEGGQGGWDLINRYQLRPTNEEFSVMFRNNENHKKMSIVGGYITYNNKVGYFSDEAKAKAKKLYKERYPDGHFKDKKHTQECKEKIGQANSIHQTGEGNSQFGTCWITKDNENKKIKKEDLSIWLDQGWSRGRKQNG